MMVINIQFCFSLNYKTLLCKILFYMPQVANIQSGYEFFSKGWEVPTKSSLEENDSEDAEQPPSNASLFMCSFYICSLLFICL